MINIGIFCIYFNFLYGLKIVLKYIDSDTKDSLYLRKAIDYKKYKIVEYLTSLENVNINCLEGLPIRTAYRNNDIKLLNILLNKKNINISYLANIIHDNLFDKILKNNIQILIIIDKYMRKNSIYYIDFTSFNKFIIVNQFVLIDEFIDTPFTHNITNANMVIDYLFSLDYVADSIRLDDSKLYDKYLDYISKKRKNKIKNLGL